MGEPTTVGCSVLDVRECEVRARAYVKQLAHGDDTGSCRVWMRGRIGRVLIVP